MLRHAKLDVVEEKGLRVSLEDTVLAHQKEEENLSHSGEISMNAAHCRYQIEMEFQ